MIHFGLVSTVFVGEISNF